MTDISESRHLTTAAVKDGYVLFIKEACETCAMLRPVYQQLRGAGLNLQVFGKRAAIPS